MNVFLIKGGKIYNPQEHRMYEGSLAVKNGTIVSDVPEKECIIIDAAGCIVTAGLIDYHVHYFNHGTENGVNPDAASFPCGITTALDGGSCGCGNYELYRKSAMAFSDVRILNDLLVASGGQATDQYPERMDAALFDRKRIRELFKKYPDNLVGLKLRLSKGIVELNEARHCLAAALSLADEIGCNIVVHITDPVMDLEELAGSLRPGDVICHIYQNMGSENILNERGEIRRGILEARSRGVLFDSSNGRSNFDLEVCQKAVKVGFKPDIISSDNNTSGFYLQPLHSLPRIMSKFLDMGMTVNEVFDAVTITPAKSLHQEDIASLAVGTVADLAIFKLKQKEVLYTDINQNQMVGHQVLIPQMTMKKGKIMYCQADFM